jgi:glycosyltransferase involved in cell wall biosynthesis
VRLLRNERNLGYRKNFERAIQECDGDYISLSDQDDVWLEDKLARTAGLLDERPDIGLVFGDADIVDQDLRPMGVRLKLALHYAERGVQLVNDGHVTADLLQTGMGVSGLTAVFRSRFVPDILPIPDAGVHDAWIATVVTIRARLYFVDAPLALYRQHGANQIGVPPPSDASRRLTHRAGSAVRARTPEELKGFADQLIYVRELLTSLPALPTDNLDVAAREVFASEMLRRERHVRVRGMLPASRVRRLAPVMRELVSLNYHRYSSGLRSTVKDLVLAEGVQATRGEGFL